MTSAKPFVIPKWLIAEAYRRVKVNRGAAGVDGVSLAAFEENRSGHLYRIWNRLSSGSYFPPAVRAVPIPKKAGGERILGVPTVCDRIAQTAVVLALEPELERVFHPDSYGYRPGKSAHDALAVTRQRCWRRDWVLEYDIRGLFDNIDHELLLRAVRHHCQQRWILLHVERWLKAPMQHRDGTVTARTVGTPQGGLCKALHKPPYAKLMIMQSKTLSLQYLSIFSGFTLHNITTTLDLKANQAMQHPCSNLEDYYLPYLDRHSQ